MSKPLSICYAAPGHTLLSTSGSARNILSLAEALGQCAEVTVAFRNISEPIQSDRFRVITIEPCGADAAGSTDDVATRGLNPLSHLAYFQTIQRFAQQYAGTFDVVLEKGWRLSGFLTEAFGKQNIPGGVVENDVRHWSESIRDFRTVAKFVVHTMAQCVAGICSRRAPVVIAETDELKTMLVRQRRIPSQSVNVIGLGVDRSLFCPRDQSLSRKALDIKSNAYVLLYVGGIDTYHDLIPVINAMARVDSQHLELHLVGDGVYRRQCERVARAARIPVRFHGQVPHHMVPRFISAADLCLAPYRVSAFHDGQVPFSTLKIPEYMACARPVLSVPSGRIQRLVAHGDSGFLIPNETSEWIDFLQDLPSRQELKRMGQSAFRNVEDISWEKTAMKYLDVCERLVAQKSQAQRRCCDP